MSVNSDTEKMTFELEAFEELLNYQSIPIEKERPTVFDISSYPHFENVISSWYAFFLDADNPHGLGSLFYSSLLELLDPEVRGGGSCEVIREYGTDGGGRIDLLVFEGREEGGEFQYPIIIENKIYAELDNNDLKDYYDSVSSKSSQNPEKLVLSLHGNEEKRKDDIGKKVKKNGYEVRSHQQYMDIIKKNLHSYIVGADPKYFMLLQDFMSNIEKMTRTAKMDANSKYYFSNAEKINELMEIQKSAHKVVIENAYRVISESAKWKWGKSVYKDGTFDFSKGKSGASFYVSISGLHYSVKMWMNRDLAARWEAIESIEKERLLAEIQGKTKGLKKDELAVMEYEITQADLDGYHGHIIANIESDFLELVDEVQGHHVK